jgi:hypothetical protein
MSTRSADLGCGDDRAPGVGPAKQRRGDRIDVDGVGRALDALLEF